ncbi:MAG: hypothetical protein IIA23_09975 [Chloroflexi bacterium]|nr:hypothetical protein [Chloroflexota bacterium]
MHTSQDVTIDRAASLRRLPVLILVSIPVTAELLFGEIIFAGHIVLLVEGLGFAWGLAAFIAIWAALGLAVLAVRDILWPRMLPLLEPLLASLASHVTGLLAHTRVKAALMVLGVSGVSAVAGLTIALAGGEIVDWAVEHRASVATFLIAAAVVFVIILLMARIGRGIQSWVRSVAATASPATRSFATLVTMVVLGPALSWPLFRLFGYSGRTTYALTLAAAPVFGAAWVPFYSLGVWSLLQGLV